MRVQTWIKEINSSLFNANKFIKLKLIPHPYKLNYIHYFNLFYNY